MVLNIETFLKQVGDNNVQSIICLNKLVASNSSSTFQIDSSIFSLGNVVGSSTDTLDFDEIYNFSNIKQNIVGIMIFCYKKDFYPDIKPIVFNINLINDENSIEFKTSNFQIIKTEDIGFNNLILSDFGIEETGDSCILDIIFLKKTNNG